jgi:hypothetical protein
VSLLPESPTRRRATVLAAIAVGAVLVAAVFSLAAKLERGRTMDELTALRDRLAGLRVRVDSCQTELAREETLFRRFDLRVDSLRTVVRDFESMDAAGVPEERYAEYLEAFGRYNDAVPQWEERADTLRVHEAFCRSLAERHNALADTLRRGAAEWEAEFGR